MKTEEKVITVLRELPPETQAEVLDYVEFLRARLAWQHAGTTKDLFAESTFEDPDTPSVYKGQPLTLDQMRGAIEWEAGEGK